MSRKNTIDSKNRVLLLKLSVVGVVMFAFANFVMPPIYTVFCQITGLNGKTNKRAVPAPSGPADMSRELRIEFLTAVDPGLPWDFRYQTSRLVTHPGQITQTLFYVKNNADHPVTGHAVPSISPNEAARYFKKTQCFCFSNQTLAGGEGKEMPVVFYVDPAIPSDLTTITLSYTFYKQPDPTPVSTH